MGASVTMKVKILKVKMKVKVKMKIKVKMKVKINIDHNCDMLPVEYDIFRSLIDVGVKFGLRKLFTR